MKKLKLLIVFGFIFQIIIYSQSCLPEGIVFTTQQEIDNFQTNYPICTEIEGDVIISGDNITNLNGLNVLTEIDGELLIGGVNPYPAIIDLTGLNNLESIGEGLYLVYLQSLVNLEGLNNLQLVGGDFVINNNNALSSLVGIESLNSIGGELFIWGNDVLPDLEGLGNLNSVSGEIRIESNSSLISLNGLDGLEIIDNNLIVNTNNSLYSLSGLNNVTSIGGYLAIDYNTSLEEISDLSNLSSIGGYLHISLNFSLTSLLGLDNINSTSIDSLFIFYNSLLSTCDVESICNYLSNPTGTIEISNNTDGCDSMEEVLEACSIGVDEYLKSIEDIFIFPNPASNVISLSDINHSLVKNVKIYDLMGNNVVFVNQLTNSLDISMFPQGIYIVEIEGEEDMKMKKLIINR